MAFRPCLSQAVLEDRLVLSASGSSFSSVLGAVANQNAAIGSSPSPPAQIAPLTSLVSAGKGGQISVVSSTQNPASVSDTSQSALLSSGSAVSAGPTGNGSTTTGSTGVTSTGTGTLTGTTGTTGGSTGTGPGSSGASIGSTLTGSSSGSGTGVTSTITGLSSTGTGMGDNGSNLGNSQTTLPGTYTQFQSISLLASEPAYALALPGSGLTNVAYGALPGVLGTPHSAIGYWGYSNGYGNGFYQFVSTAMNSGPQFNNAYRGYFRLKDSFISGFGFSLTTQGSGAASSPAVFGTDVGGMGGIGTGGRGMGTGGLGSGGSGRSGAGILSTGVGGRVLEGQASVAQAWEVLAMVPWVVPLLRPGPIAEAGPPRQLPVPELRPPEHQVPESLEPHLRLLVIQPPAAREPLVPPPGARAVAA